MTQQRAAIGFTLALAVLAGCQSTKQAQLVPPPTLPEATIPDASVPAGDLAFLTTPDFTRVRSPGAVNIFGEIDGVGADFPASTGFNLRRHTQVDEGFDADVAVSPDGQWLVFASTRHAERADIYMQRVEGQAVIQLTADDADDAFPTVSPDQRRIAFASNRAGSWDIYVMDAEGKNVTQITRGNANEIAPSFSPDGTRLVYSAMGSRSGQWELWVVNLKTLEQTMIGPGLFPRWSPRTDMDLIAFQRPRQRGTRWFSIWTLELQNNEARQITEVAFSAQAALVAPAWCPMGEQIAFSSVTDPAVTNAAGQDVWVVRRDGSDRRRLTDGRGVNAQPVWSSDGRIYFVSDRGGPESVWSVAVNAASGESTATVAE
jgi:TolB protein